MSADRHLEAGHPEARLAARGFIVPQPAVPAGHYLPARQVGDVVMTSSISAKDGAVVRFAGRLGESLTLDEGRSSAELAVLNCLAAVRDLIGDLDRVSSVVKVTGFVNSAPDFYDQHRVVDAASDVLGLAFEDRGAHVRAAIGVASLPLQCSVGIELTVELAQESEANQTSMERSLDDV